jgi:hypothetical protein
MFGWKLIRPRAFPRLAISLGGMMICLCPEMALAQRHGSGAAGIGPPGLTRPDGVDEKDTLADFHHALAVEASGPQIAEFKAMIKGIGDAQDLAKSLVRAASPEQTQIEGLVHALDADHQQWKRFTDGFSDPQKSGLREAVRRVTKADSAVEEEQKKLDQAAVNTQPAEVATRAEGLRKAVAGLQDEELALGREMGIMLASGNDLTFILPAMNTTTRIANRSLAVGVTGTLSQTSVDAAKRSFKLQVVTDFSDLQQNFAAVLRGRLDRSQACGERVSVLEAVLTPAEPASFLEVRLHFERWTCVRLYGQNSANELAESDGTVDLKLTPSVDPAQGVQVSSSIERVAASGMLGDALQSGDLGDDLRRESAAALLAAIRAGLDFKTTLPPALQTGPTLEVVRFRDGGAGVLSLMVEGRMQLSDDQASQLAAQLNQTLSAQTAPASPAASPTVTSH